MKPSASAALSALAGFCLPTLVTAADGCADTCLLGAPGEASVCTLWDTAAQQWIEQPDDGLGQLHNRARTYLPWLRQKLMPAGGVMSAVFTDDSYRKVASYGGERDVAIWTGSYLAAEALRLMATGAPDAFDQVRETAETLHHWWNIPGDPGYLARYAAPSSSPAAIKATLPSDDDEVYRDWLYDGVFWDWRDDVSRDQYQGVLLGYSLAYEALSAWADDPVRGEAARQTMEQLRADTVEFAEQLARRETRQVNISINGEVISLELEVENVVYLTAAMPDGVPTLELDLTTGEVKGGGVLVFWPNPSEYIRQIPGFRWFPPIYLQTQAIQLGAAFSIALQMSKDVAGYQERYQALAGYYASKVDGWLDIAEGWRNTNRCGDGYHGLNIGFMPAYSWARLETDPLRKERLQRNLLADLMWPAVAADKNVFFAFIYASQAPADTDVSAVVSAHVAQLSGFPVPPNQARPVDLVGQYPEDPNCPGLSEEAVDVAQRVPATFIWERQPWKLEDPGVPNRLYGGVDYLLAYWMGRRYGYIRDDAPATCLLSRPVELRSAGGLELPPSGSVQTGIGLLTGWYCEADAVAVAIDDKPPMPAAYGSDRTDTLSICGDTDNGFAFPINFNQLGDGRHRAQVWVDQQPAAVTEFEVRTLGAPYRDGLSAEQYLAGFPSPGQQTLLRWQTANQGFVVADVAAAAAIEQLTDAPAALGYLEWPASGSTQSGVGLISGWHCDAESVSVQFDDGPLLAAGHGIERPDTAAICGDTNNGFAFPLNFGNLGSGVHWVMAYAGSQAFSTAVVNVAAVGPGFVTGLAGEYPIWDFPEPGLTTLVGWQGGNQSFTILGVQPQ